jgi:hypothetical protein
VQGTQHIWQEVETTNPLTSEMGYKPLQLDEGEDSKGMAFAPPPLLLMPHATIWIGIGLVTLANDSIRGILIHVRLPYALFSTLVFDSNKRDKQSQSQAFFLKRGSHTLNATERIRLLEWLFGENYTGTTTLTNNINLLFSGSSTTTTPTTTTTTTTATATTTTATSTSTVSEAPLQSLSNSQMIWSNVLLLPQDPSAFVTHLIEQYTDIFKSIGLLS